MKTTPDDPTRTRRRLICLVCAGVAFLVLAAIGVYGLVTGPNDTDPSPDGPPTPIRIDPDQPTPRLPTIAPSTDPDDFAREAAHALFTWDTTSGFLPLDYTAVLLDVGDPTGNEQAGLASDIASYLPPRDAWVDLRQYSTSQHLTITDAYVPEQWAGAVEHPVAFTIFLACPPDDDPPTGNQSETSAPDAGAVPSCYLLRLSILDQPLR
jgi:hypothetical protein